MVTGAHMGVLGRDQADNAQTQQRQALVLTGRHAYTRGLEAGVLGGRKVVIIIIIIIIFVY